MRRPAFGPLLFLACSCAVPSIERAEREIVGGTGDAGDPAVGAVLIEDASGQVRALCTGTLISPRVVMTAAHCVRLEDETWAPREVYFGARVDGTGALARRPVVHAVYHPDYDGESREGLDLALLLLDRAPGIEPVPINRAPLEGHEGDDLRLVGFGVTDGGRADAGSKREVTTVLDDVAPRLLWVFDTGRNTCNGDSGGPAFATLDGVEVVAGVTSFGDEGCDRTGGFVRVDAHAASFIDPWIRDHDPDGALPAPPLEPNLEDDQRSMPVAEGCSTGGGAPAAPAALLLALAILLRRR